MVDDVYAGNVCGSTSLNSYLCFDLGGTKIAAAIVTLPAVLPKNQSAGTPENRAVSLTENQFKGGVEAKRADRPDPASELGELPGVIPLGSIPTESSSGGAHVLQRLSEFVAQTLKKVEASATPLPGSSAVPVLVAPTSDGTPGASETNESGPGKSQSKERMQLGNGKLWGIAIASAGVVDPDTGVILSATDLIPGWAGQNIYRVLRAVTSLPVRLIQDVGAHGLGEATFGAGQNFSRLLSVGVGTGIGGAIIENGNLQTGAHQVAGHVGHVCHPLAAGFPCSCGTECGHVEAVASGSGLATLYASRKRQLAESGQDIAEGGKASLNSKGVAVTGKDVAERAAAGEQAAIAVIADSARALGECLGGIANTVDPEAIVLSGSVTKIGETWLNALQAGFADSALPLLKNIPILSATLGDYAPLVGAAIECQNFLKQQSEATF